MGLLLTRTCIHPLQYVHFHTQSLLCWFNYRYGSFTIMHKTLVSSVTTSFRVYSKRVLNNGLPQMCSAIFCWTERNSAGHFLHSAITWCELWSPKSPILFEFSGQWVYIIIIMMSALGRFCVTAVMICIVFCRAFSHPAKFMSYIGLDQKPVQPSSADTCGINRSHVSTLQDVDPTLPPATTGLNSLASLSLGGIMAWPVSAPHPFIHGL